MGSGGDALIARRSEPFFIGQPDALVFGSRFEIVNKAPEITETVIKEFNK